MKSEKALWKRRPFVSAVFCLVGLPGPSIAAPGDLDPVFGVSGRVSFDPQPGFVDFSPAKRMIVQEDGRIVVVGTSASASSPYPRSLFLARFGQDGTPDLTFGNGGVMNSSPVEYGNDVVQQSDGRLVVAGSWMGDFALMRVDELGVADATFGSGGIVRFDPGFEDEATGLIEQPDGRLVVVGHSVTPEIPDRDSDIVLARFSQDGALDTSFGSGGVTRITFESGNEQGSTWESVSSIILDNDGGLLIGGYRFHEHVPNFTAADLVLVRLTPDGVPDPAFGTGGIVELAYGSETDSIEPYSLTLLPDGRILVAGGVGGETGWGLLLPGDGFLARFMADGSLDTSFGVDGIVIADIGVHGDFDAVATLSDGSVLAAGSTEIPIGTEDWMTDIVLALFDPDGNLVEDFGDAGTALADFGGFGFSPYSHAEDLLVLPDGNFLVAGSHRAEGSRLAIARFESSGTGFGGLVGLTETSKTLDSESTSITFDVRRTGGSTGTVSVDFETFDHALQAGSDFTPAQGELTWADGDNSVKTISFTLLNTAPFSGEGPLFDVVLTNPQGGAELAGSLATVETRFDASTPETPPASGESPPVSSVVTSSSVPAGTSGGGSFDPLMLLFLLLISLLSRPVRFDWTARNSEGRSRCLECRDAAIAVLPQDVSH